MEFYFFRHGETMGNAEKRYVGVTDEDITKAAEYELKKIKANNVDIVYSSPMKRCINTANIIFGNADKILNGLAEMDFGDFEYKNYDELKNNKFYQNWLDSGGKCGFPNGESYENFKNRCVKTFEYILKYNYYNYIKTAAVVTHGGVIMAIFEKFAGGEFYDYQIKNGRCIYSKYDKNIFCYIKRDYYD